jgi:hypothetical protein
MQIALAALAALASPQSDQGAEPATHYLTGTATVFSGRGLDLDTGGLFQGARTADGAATEFLWPAFSAGTRRDDAAESVIRCEFATDASFVMPGGFNAPCYRLTTDRGRTAWLQFLPRQGLAAVRFVTRVDGTGPALPAPTALFCVGGERGIEIRFSGNAAFTSYRIERREGVDGKFAPLADAVTSGLVDRSAHPGVRYGYRVSGRTADRELGIPAIVQGTRSSRGVRSGSVDVGPEAIGIDLLTGERVSPDAADLTLLRGDVVDWEGFALGRLPGTELVDTTFWECWEGAARPGLPFLARVRGGGIARCKLEWDPRTQSGRFTHLVDPDGSTIASGPVLRRVDGSGVRGPVILNADAPPGWTVATVTARRVDDEPDAARPLAVHNRAAIDRETGEGDVIEYIAEAIDAHGRRSPPGSLVVAMREPGIRRGSFEFHYQQGFSFLREKLCASGEADVVFESCAGGVSSVTLAAPRGIYSLGPILGRENGTAQELLARVQSVDPKRLPRTAGVADGDDRLPASDVFVMRTRAGGWVKLAIVERKKHGDWQMNPVVVRWVHNPDAPIFEDGPVSAIGPHGIGLLDDGRE